MEGYGPQTYGERAADRYDEWHRDLPGLDDCVECLAELAGPGPVLELGVGTGRRYRWSARARGGRYRCLTGDACQAAGQARR